MDVYKAFYIVQHIVGAQQVAAIVVTWLFNL